MNSTTGDQSSDALGKGSGMPDGTRQRAVAAERQRRRRIRQKCGLVELEESLVERHAAPSNWRRAVVRFAKAK